jgi:hypothetical protein
MQGRREIAPFSPVLGFPSWVISAQGCDDSADPLDVPERLLMGQARPLHAQEDMVSSGGLGVVQDLVLHLLGLADQKAALSEVVEGGIEVAPGVALTPGGIGTVLEQERPAAGCRRVRSVATHEAFADHRAADVFRLAGLAPLVAKDLQAG